MSVSEKFALHTDCQGSIVVARFKQWPPEALGAPSLYGHFLFGDGSQRMLAAMTTWIATLLVWEHHGPEALNNQYALGMISSFLRITTNVKATEARGSPLDGVVNRIVQQNIAAKVQPITSFAWAGILKAFGASFEESVAAYNNHPDVIAHDREEHGGGSIALDSRKKQGVKNFLERTSQGAYNEVLASTHDYPYNLGPFGEGFSVSNQCFLGSKANLEAIPGDSADGPAPNEPFAEVSWLSAFRSIQLLVAFNFRFDGQHTACQFKRLHLTD